VGRWWRQLTGTRPPLWCGASSVIAADPGPQKRRGGYYTPRVIAEFLVGWAVRTAADRVLDPACGEAVFLQAAAARLRGLGRSPTVDQVVGYELDAGVAAEAQHAAPEATVATADFFAKQANARRYDSVVGNPPYIRYHYFAGEVRRRALARARDEGVILTQLTSSWAPFVVHAATFLNPDGRMALVLPAELLSTDYAKPVREFLRRRFARVDVLTFEDRIFPGALVDAVLLLGEGQGPGQVHVHRLPNAGALGAFGFASQSPTNAAKWTQGLVDADATKALALAATQMRQLGELATVDIGVVTGANKFFVLTDAQARTRGLGGQQLHRLVARGHQLPGYHLGDAEWERQQRDGELIWLFSPTTDSGPAGSYIREGEATGVHESYKCRIRSPWWRLRLPDAPDLILSYMSNHAPRMVANDAAVLTTNLLHNVRLLDRADVAGRAHLLALSWPNSATMLSCELAGRAYGGGVLKLETREAERVLVPALTARAEAELRRRAAAVDLLLRAGLLEAAADLVDPVVLADVAPRARVTLREAWLDLRTRRKRRGASPGGG
jgi:adenine-specific DNA-methyltransferase